MTKYLLTTYEMAEVTEDGVTFIGSSVFADNQHEGGKLNINH